MPKPSLLPRLISLVKPEERRKYEKWIEMSTVEMNTLHDAWFKTVLNHLAERNFPKQLDRETMLVWWQNRFPQSLPKRQMDRLNLDLCRFTEDFLTYEFQKTFADRNKVDLTFALLRRKAYRLFLKYYNRELKRYRSLSDIKLDFRYWTNYNQLLMVGMEWNNFNVGYKKTRGYKAISLEELRLSFNNTIVHFTLERGLFRLEQNEAIGKVVSAILEEEKTNPSNHIQSLLTIYDWSSRKDIPNIHEITQSVNQLLATSTTSSDDFLVNILSAYHNKLAAWEKRTNRYDLINHRISLYKHILEKHGGNFSTIHFFVLVKLHSELIGYVDRKISLKASSSRQHKIHRFIEAAKTDLLAQISKLSEPNQKTSHSIMQLHLCFELDDEQELVKLFHDWFNAPVINPLYEAAARWLKAKYLFFKKEEQELFIHTKAFEAFLHTSATTKSPEYSPYFTALKASCRYIRRISTAVNKGSPTTALEQRLSKETSIYDRPWLEAILQKSKG